MLTTKRCVPCTSATPRIGAEGARQLLVEIPGFELDSSATRICRSFGFSNFHETMAFVNAVAWIAHREDHHPDLEVSYKTCRVTFSTHANGGLSENDFICAAKVNALL
jgi:4a-hydroxytetrahydrobiopterin dehydratase